MTASAARPLLDQMLQAACKAMSYVDGVSKEAFLIDTRTQEAVAMNLMIIGEAATRLARDHADLAAGYPDVPWRHMQGMRNRIAHGYFELNMDVVWDTVLTALPELVYRLNSICDASRASSGLPDLPQSGDV